MAGNSRKKAGCPKCGAEIRPDTQFCYSCGAALVELARESTTIPAEITEVKADEVPASRPASETESSLADLEAKLASDFPPADPAKSKLESAAAERKRARRISKKQHEVVWEPADDASYRLYYLVVLLVFVAAAAIVFFTVFLK
jgi:hypothetical protein